MSNEINDKVTHWTKAHAEGRIGRRQWLKLMLACGLSLPAIAKLLESAVAADANGLRIYMVPKFTGFIFFELAKAGGAQAGIDAENSHGCSTVIDRRYSAAAWTFSRISSGMSQLE